MARVLLKLTPRNRNVSGLHRHVLATPPSTFLYHIIYVIQYARPVNSEAGFFVCLSRVVFEVIIIFIVPSKYVISIFYLLFYHTI